MQFFTHLRLLFAAMLITPIAITATAVHAQSNDAVYGDIVDAINEGVDAEGALDSTMQVVRREYAAVREIAMVEEMSPGLIDELMKELRPVFRDYQDRVTAMYRPQYIDLFAGTFTPDEARSIAAFYRSDIGRRITRSVSQNFSPDATLEDSANLATSTDAEVR